MSSPIGEPPVRRHLATEVSALMLQAARGARRRALKRQAILRERRADGPLSMDVAAPQGSPGGAVPPAVDEPLRTVLAAPFAATRSAATAVSLQTTAAEGQRPSLMAPSPSAGSGGDVAEQPFRRAASTVDIAAAPAPAPRPALSPPPVARLMAAARARAARAEALTREALALSPAPGSPAPIPAAKPAGTRGQALAAAAAPGRTAPDLTVPPHQGMLQAATPQGSLHRVSQGAPEEGPPARTRWPGDLLAPRPQSPAPAPTAAPFGPHPGPPGPLPTIPGANAPKEAPAPQAESDLLTEERLREQVANILRADALRHGLDLKER